VGVCCVFLTGGFGPQIRTVPQPGDQQENQQFQQEPQQNQQEPNKRQTQPNNNQTMPNKKQTKPNKKPKNHNGNQYVNRLNTSPPIAKATPINASNQNNHHVEPIRLPSPMPLPSCLPAFCMSGYIFHFRFSIDLVACRPCHKHGPCRAGGQPPFFRSLGDRPSPNERWRPEQSSCQGPPGVVQAIQEALGCIAGNGDIRPDKVGLVPLVWLRLNSISGGPLQACGT